MAPLQLGYGEPGSVGTVVGAGSSSLLGPLGSLHPGSRGKEMEQLPTQPIPAALIGVGQGWLGQQQQ